LSLLRSPANDGLVGAVIRHTHNDFGDEVGHLRWSGGIVPILAGGKAGYFRSLFKSLTPFAFLLFGHRFLLVVLLPDSSRYPEGWPASGQCTTSYGVPR
jgi:hypothetical protein